MFCIGDKKACRVSSPSPSEPYGGGARSHGQDEFRPLEDVERFRILAALVDHEPDNTDDTHVKGDLFLGHEVQEVLRFELPHVDARGAAEDRGKHDARESRDKEG
jgi:hypothetical protein